MISLDFEASGCDPERNFPVAAGVAIFQEGKITTEKFLFPVPSFPRDFASFKNQPGWEQRCVDEFWSKLSPSVLDGLRHPDSVDQWVPLEGMAEIDHLNQAMNKLNKSIMDFAAWLRKTINEMPEEPTLITDNGVYDWPLLNYYIHKFGVKEEGQVVARPLSYSTKYGYLSTRDVGDLLRSFDKKKVQEVLDSEYDSANTHLPDEDAKHMIHKYLVWESLREAVDQEAVFNARKRKIQE